VVINWAKRVFGRRVGLNLGVLCAVLVLVPALIGAELIVRDYERRVTADVRTRTSGGLDSLSGIFDIERLRTLNNAEVAGERLGPLVAADMPPDDLLKAVNDVRLQALRNTSLLAIVDANGQLGTASSSARVKEQIRDMGETSSALLKLRPVTFRYKGQVQGSNPLHFGLIAEEVDEVLPELVLHRPTGEAETVLYNEIPAMLLNELQKQRQTIEDLKARLARLEARLTTEQR